MKQHVGKITTYAVLMLASGFLTLTHSAAKDQPLWEAGAGLATVSFPAYRGAEQRKSYVLPLPYFEYHGDRLKIDREGLRSPLFGNESLELALSLAIAPAVNSNDITVRAGMPSLRPTMEIGPRLDYRLWQSADERLRLRLELPVRRAFTLDTSPQDAGWVAHPLLNLSSRNTDAWNFRLRAGLLFGDQRQHDFYYSVAPEYATSARPAYAAHGGFAGTQYQLTLTRRLGDFRLSLIGRYDNLAGARFADSPLVQRQDYFITGVIAAWIFGKSSRRVEVE